MNVREINEALLRGDASSPGVLPHLDRLGRGHLVFAFSFGLDELPERPGVILVRGARQYGKSTWLESAVRSTVSSYGPGSALYVNGDELDDAAHLMREIRELVPLFARSGRVRRLFIDEITAISDWERALKRLIDAGDLDDVLVVTTGSKAADLRHGSERLPGRKGRLARTSFHFTPISYAEFRRACGTKLGRDTLVSYLLSGGSPVALSELASTGCLPEYTLEIVRDWVLGEFAASGRQRSSLMAVFHCLLRYGGVPVGQAKLAREAGLANNTVAAGYIELLADLLCVAPALAWDESRRVRIHRRPCKFHLINLLAAAAWHPARPRSVAEWDAWDPAEQGRWIEWLVAQETWRRSAIQGEAAPEAMTYWQSKERELDFVLAADRFLEVKRGRATPLEWSWFPRVFPRAHLTVISSSRFETRTITGMTLEDFLLHGPAAV